MPRWRENLQTFGWGPNADGSVLMTRCLALFSTATKQFLHIEIGNYSQCERALLVNSLGHLQGSDLLVMDRGYPAWWLFALLRQCARHLQRPPGQLARGRCSSTSSPQNLSGP